MTNERMALAELLEKGSDSDLLREMIGYVAQRLMEADVESLVGARPRGAQREPGDMAQWLSRARLAHPKWDDRTEDSQAAQGELLSGFPGAQKVLREGTGGGDTGGLRPGH